MFQQTIQFKRTHFHCQQTWNLQFIEIMESKGGEFPLIRMLLLEKSEEIHLVSVLANLRL